MNQTELTAAILVAVATLAREAATVVTEATAKDEGAGLGTTYDRKPARPLRALADKLETGARALDEGAYEAAMAGRSEWWRSRHNP